MSDDTEEVRPPTYDELEGLLRGYLQGEQRDIRAAHSDKRVPPNGFFAITRPIGDVAMVISHQQTAPGVYSLVIRATNGQLNLRLVRKVVSSFTYAGKATLAYGDVEAQDGEVTGTFRIPR